jgi:hypothetical protein
MGFYPIAGVNPVAAETVNLSGRTPDTRTYFG